jgi:hypothetical protein
LYWNQLGNRVVEGGRGVQTNVADQDPVLSWPLDPGGEKRIWDKHPGSFLDFFEANNGFIVIESFHVDGALIS